MSADPRLIIALDLAVPAALAYAYLAVKVFTGDYTGSEAARESRSTVFIGGVGAGESATSTLSRMIGGGVSKGGMGRVSRLG